MALLIHELEGVIIQEVVPIGSGGDYVAILPGATSAMQIEASGIRHAPTEGPCRARLREKLDQVLKESDRGFASVTTFQLETVGTAHSYLHYTEVTRRLKRGRAKKGKRKKP